MKITTRRINSHPIPINLAITLLDEGLIDLARVIGGVALGLAELERRGGVRGGVDARMCLPRPSGTGGLQRPGEDGGDVGVGGLQRRSGEVRGGGRRVGGVFGIVLESVATVLILKLRRVTCAQTDFLSCTETISWEAGHNNAWTLPENR